MPVMTSRRQRGRLRGSSGESEGCGTRMVPSLAFLRGTAEPEVAAVAEASGLRSESVEVPVCEGQWVSVVAVVLRCCGVRDRIPGTCSSFRS